MDEKKKHNIFHGQFEFDGKNLVPRGGAVQKYKVFQESLSLGQSVEVFLESNPDDGTLTQIAKIKVCIRTLAAEQGCTFEEMQLQVKKESGLCFGTIFEGERCLYCKSFADCSVEELSAAITAIIAIGDLLNMNLR